MNCIISSRRYRHIGRLDSEGELVSLASKDVSRDAVPNANSVITTIGCNVYFHRKKNVISD